MVSKGKTGMMGKHQRMSLLHVSRGEGERWAAPQPAAGSRWLNPVEGELVGTTSSIRNGRVSRSGHQSCAGMQERLWGDAPQPVTKLPLLFSPRGWINYDI